MRPVLVPGGLLTTTGPAWSADPTAAAKNNNQQLVDTVRRFSIVGATLYNQGDRNGCYHLFEGAAASPQFAACLALTITAALRRQILTRP